MPRHARSNNQPIPEPVDLRTGLRRTVTDDAGKAREQRAHVRLGERFAVELRWGADPQTYPYWRGTISETGASVRPIGTYPRLDERTEGLVLAAVAKHHGGVNELAACGMVIHATKGDKDPPRYLLGEVADDVGYIVRAVDQRWRAWRVNGLHVEQIRQSGKPSNGARQVKFTVPADVYTWLERHRQGDETLQFAALRVIREAMRAELKREPWRANVSP